MAQDSNQPEFPRVEPEILPPDHSSRARPPGWGGDSSFRQMYGTQRVYMTRLGPFSIALMLFAFAALTAVILFALIGAVLLWLPVVALFVVAAIVARAFRRRIF
jgi:hypothetical protein